MTELADALHDIDDTSPEVHAAYSRWYPELKEIAHARIQRSALRGRIQTTSLVHDSYLKLASQASLQFGTRLQFLAYASRTLRSLIIDQLREQRALRRGGGRQLLTLDTALAAGVSEDIDLERLGEALEALAAIDPPKARLVELRFFGGLTALEIAESIGSSERSVQRDWSKARALLLALLAEC